MPNVETILAVVAAIAVAAFVQGYAGFGIGIVSITLLAFLPRGMAGLTAVISLCATVAILLLLRLSHAERGVDWASAWRLIAGAAVGMPLGYWFIHAFGDRPVFRIALGAALLAFAGNGLFGRRVQRKLPRWVGVPAGVCSGFLSGAFVSGGPPVVIYLYSRTDDPRDMKATIQFVFLANLAYRHTAIALTGDYTISVLALAAWAAPVGAIALYLGHRLSRRGSVALFRKVVFTLIALFGVVLIVRAAFAWAE